MSNSYSDRYSVSYDPNKIDEIALYSFLKSISPQDKKRWLKDALVSHFKKTLEDKGNDRNSARLNLLAGTIHSEAKLSKQIAQEPHYRHLNESKAQRLPDDEPVIRTDNEEPLTLSEEVINDARLVTQYEGELQNESADRDNQTAPLDSLVKSNICSIMG